MQTRRRSIVVLGTATLLAALALSFTLLPPTYSRSSATSAKSFTGNQFGFEENLGQYSESARFVARAEDFSLFLEPNVATMKLPRRSINGEALSIGMTLSGVQAARMSGTQPLPGLNHYMLSADPKDSIRNVRTYAEVKYDQVYPGIDLVFHGDERQVEYDFVVAANVDPAQIGLTFTGIDRAELDRNGDLILQAGGAAVRQRRPQMYQEIDGRRQSVAGDFVLKSANEVAFRVGTYDRQHALVIDPILLFSTLYGGCRDRQGIADMTIDAAGNSYVIGYYPWDCDIGTFNIFVSKFGPNGAPVFKTTLGGILVEQPGGIALDRLGDIWITGSTQQVVPGAPAFPVTQNAFQAVHAGATDVFVTQLDPTGSTILYSTLLGGAGADAGEDIVVDGQGRICITGQTSSLNFPTHNATQPQLRGPSDAFVTVFDPTGTTLVFSTYFGGSADDNGVRLAFFNSGISVVGNTSSADFPLLAPLQPTFGGGASDAFLARFSFTGALIVSSFLGGSGAEQAFGISFDNAGHAYVVGGTNSTDFPTSHPLQPQLSHPPESDAFLAKVSTDFTSLDYSTYLQIGADLDCTGLFPPGPCGAVAVDRDNNAYVTAGSPRSRGVFVAKIDPAGTNRVYTFNGFGGTAIAVGAATGFFPNLLRQPYLFIAGRTQAQIFPVQKAFQNEKRSFEFEDGWLMKLENGQPLGAAAEENDPRINYTGSWELEVLPTFSGGTALRSNQAGATASITFTGTGIQVIGRRDPAAGILGLNRSFNPTPISLDTYAAPVEPRALIVSISNLQFGTYTITLQVTGTKNNRSSGNWVWIDGINVLGTD
jgi:hypothetical protein